ncbi:MAG TPA: DUF4350 domain-containing protein, partial [Cyclobacteriaceae bacterium]|nr:DUF4350 domain-containing protein [Cyclobacteriaceae bacterium]
MKSTPVVLGVLVGGLALILLYYFYTSNRPKYQWVPTLRHDSEQPYGTSFLKKMLQTYRPDGEFTINQRMPFHKLAEKEDFSNGQTDLVVIGQSAFFDNADVEAIKKFLRDGNNVFISTLSLPRELIDSVYTDGDCALQLSYDDDPGELVRANFYNDTFKKAGSYEFRYRFLTEDVSYSWNRVAGPAICDDMGSMTALGYQGYDHVNFFRINFEGKGNIFVHTEPIMFTNYFMVQPDKVDYASAVFSYLPGRNIIWDEVSKLPFSKSDNPYESPLYYIMQQPALKYAWWMLLVGGLLYIIFASKRRQRVIPVIEAKTN